MIFDIVGCQDDFGDYWFLSLIGRQDGKTKDEWTWTEIMNGKSTKGMLSNIKRIREENKIYEAKQQEKIRSKENVSLAGLKTYRDDRKLRRCEKAIIKLNEKDIETLEKAIVGIVPAYVENALEDLLTTGSADGKVDAWLRSTLMHWSEYDMYEHDKYFTEMPIEKRYFARESAKRERKEYKEINK